MSLCEFDLHLQRQHATKQRSIDSRMMLSQPRQITDQRTMLLDAPLEFAGDALTIFVQRLDFTELDDLAHDKAIGSDCTSEQDRIFQKPCVAIGLATRTATKPGMTLDG